MRLTCSTDLVYPLQHPENSLGHLQLFLHNCQSFWGLYWRKSLLESTLLEERGRGMIDFTLSSNLIITGGPREEVGHCVESGLSVTLRAWQGQSLTCLSGSPRLSLSSGNTTRRSVSGTNWSHNKSRVKRIIIQREEERRDIWKILRSRELY